MRNYLLPKISSELEQRISQLVVNQSQLGYIFIKEKSSPKLYYRIGGGRYWKIFTTFQPIFILNGERGISSRENYLYFRTQEIRDVVVAILSSSLFYWYFILTTNCRDLNPSDLNQFPISIADMNTSIITDIISKSQILMNDYKNKALLKNKTSSKTGNIQYQEFYPRLSKPIIDDIDKLLAKHYGFTEEELDFIINYDIKYRMGNELNDEEEE